MTDDRDWGLTCAEFLELTTEYLDDALSTADRSRFEAHLATCEGCTTVVGQLEEQIAISGELAEEDIGPEALTELLDVFADWKKGSP